MHLQGTRGFIMLPAKWAILRSALLYVVYPVHRALALVPYSILTQLARLKWHEYDECALANPNRCKVKFGLMHEGSARAGIIVIGGLFR